MRLRSRAQVAALSLTTTVGLAMGGSPLAPAGAAESERRSGSAVVAQGTGATALQMARAMATSPELVVDAELVTTPSALARAVESTGAAGFPTHGSSYAVISTGDAGALRAPNDAESTGVDLGGGGVRGDTDFDVTVLRVGVDVPEGDNCLSVGFKFLSEEFPEYVGSSYNDAFIVEVDSSTWITSGSSIAAPDNIAFDPAGNVISVNATGATTMSATHASGTTYDGGTPKLKASVEVDPGRHNLYLSIFDQADKVYDSTALLDSLVSAEVPDGQCVSGAQVSRKPCTIKGTRGKDRLEGTVEEDVICGFGKNDVLIGKGGNDVLRGGPGEDKLAGGAGDDQLDGGSNDDSLRGDAGADLLDGGVGKDLVTYYTATGPALVDLAAETGTAPRHDSDVLDRIEGAFGTSHADRIFGDQHSNHLFGGPGGDLVAGRGSSDLLYGSGGADIVKGGGQGDLLLGGRGEDELDGGRRKDACYGGRGGGSRTDCEVGHDGDPDNAGARTSLPTLGATEAGVRVLRTRDAAYRQGGATYWYIGNGDYLFVYSQAATQNIGSWNGTSSWEGQVCRLLRYTPVRTACSATSKVQAIEKQQMRWFLWHAKRNGGCAVGIWDYGRHGVNQFTKRWKTRSATYYNYNVAIPWVTPGKPSYIKVSDRKEVRGDYVVVSC